MGDRVNILGGNELKPQWELFVAECDHSAYKALYLHYYNYFTFIGLKKGCSGAKVKDTLNEVFLYIWENHAKLGHVKHHHNYLLTAFLRKLYRKEKYITEECFELDTLPEFVVTPSVEVDYIIKGSQKDLTSILNNFIEKLPERQRSLIYQKFYLDLSYQEIADANNISINTVYNTVYKAVDKLKILIGKEQLQALSFGFAALLTIILFFLIKQ